MPPKKQAFAEANVYYLGSCFMVEYSPTITAQ